MIARLSNGPVIAEAGHLDIVQPVHRKPEQWIRMAPVGGATGWARLELGMPPWEGEALYELAVPRPIDDVDGDEVFIYVRATDFPVEPGRIWQGKGAAARQKVRIVALEANGGLVFERLAGADPVYLRKPGHVARDQLAAAFEPTDDFDYEGLDG